MRTLPAQALAPACPRAQGQPASSAALLLNGRGDSEVLARLLAFILAHHGGVSQVDHLLDQETGQSFSRIEWDLAHFDLADDELEPALEEVARCDRGAFRIISSRRPARVAIFVSKQDHCLCDLLLRHRTGELNADIRVVISNHLELKPLVEQFGIAYVYSPITPETQALQEQRQLAILRRHRIELVVLARYMRILGPALVDQFPARIINIHHAFLPAFPGGNPYQRALDRGVKLVGATAHYVTAGLDEGPIIDQGVGRVTHRDSVGDLIARGRDLERVVLAQAVRLHLENRVAVCGNKTVVFG